MAHITFSCQQCGKVVNTYRSPSNLRKHQPRFCSVQCTGRAQSGESNPAFRGGRYIDPNGYVQVHKPDHPRADCRGYVYEHRLVAEKKIGRPLRDGEVVHHRNGSKSDNRPENVDVCQSQGVHMNSHHRNGGRRWVA